MKNNNGISLVALVITIIVIIILTGAVILSGLVEDGIIGKAKYAVDEHNKVQEIEKISYAVNIVKAQNEGQITTEKLNKELNKSFKDDVEVIEISDGWYYKECRILKNGEIIKGKLLPDEYQQVEYIQSTGIQYIDTGVSNVEGYGAEIKCMPTKEDQVGNNILIGVNASRGECFLGMKHVYNNGTAFRLSVLEINKLYNIEINLYNNKTYLKVDNEVIYDKTFTASNNRANQNVCLFGSPDSFNTYSRGFHRIYSAKIYNVKEEIIRDYIPCYRISDGKTGLYDLVTGEFYGNMKTGEFLKGANI